MTYYFGQEAKALSGGEVEPDDRDAMEFQEVWSAEDFFPERVEKDAGGLVRRLLWQATQRKNLDHVTACMGAKRL